MEDSLILSQSEYEQLLEEIHRLQARITELTALRDDLVYHVCPALQAEYDEKIVSLERELMAANMYLKQLQRTIEILQAQMNQQQKPSMEAAQAQAKEENREFEEDLHRKAEEAREFKKKWEESQWSKHDRQEKENREKEEQEGENREKEEQKKKNQDTENQDKENPDTENQGTENRYQKAQDGENQGKENGDQNESGGDSSGDASGSSENRSGKKETVSDKIKRLYRKIVKRLHPDVHPNLTEHEKELWNRAVKAQQDGDLGQLERIWEELSGMDAPEDAFDDTPEGRMKLKELMEKLKVRLRLLELEIEHIRTEFPYKFKSFLEDPVAVEEVRRGIQSKIDNVREMNRQLEAFINEMKEKLEKGEKL